MSSWCCRGRSGSSPQGVAGPSSSTACCPTVEHAEVRASGFNDFGSASHVAGCWGPPARLRVFEVGVAAALPLGLEPVQRGASALHHRALETAGKLKLSVLDPTVQLWERSLLLTWWHVACLAHRDTKQRAMGLHASTC